MPENNPEIECKWVNIKKAANNTVTTRANIVLYDGSRNAYTLSDTVGTNPNVRRVFEHLGQSWPTTGFMFTATDGLVTAVL